MSVCYLGNKEDALGKLCLLTKQLAMSSFSLVEKGIFKTFWHVTLSFRAAFCRDWHGVLFSFQDPCMESSTGINSATCFHITASGSCLRFQAMCTMGDWTDSSGQTHKDPCCLWHHTAKNVFLLHRSAVTLGINSIHNLCTIWRETRATTCDPQLLYMCVYIHNISL